MFPKLTSLDLRHCNKEELFAVMHLFDKNTNLKELGIDAAFIQTFIRSKIDPLAITSLNLKTNAAHYHIGQIKMEDLSV